MSGGISQEEKDTLVRFIERNLQAGPTDLDEGIGTVYERRVIDRYFRDLAERYGIRSVLESPADGVTGVPGINSLEFARQGGHVTLANPSQRMLDNALNVWKKNDLTDRVTMVQGGPDHVPLPDASFDLVWNYCIFERFQHAEALVEEMLRLSRKYVLVMTQNIHNFGTPLHRAYHKAHKLEWDHGRPELMTYEGIHGVLSQFPVNVVHDGAVDAPPWFDTWDMPLRGEIKKFLQPLGLRWKWSIDDDTGPKADVRKPGFQDRLLWFFEQIENTLPQRFKRWQAHHLYVLVEKR